MDRISEKLRETKFNSIYGYLNAYDAEKSGKIFAGINIVITTLCCLINGLNCFRSLGNCSKFERKVANFSRSILKFSSFSVVLLPLAIAQALTVFSLVEFIRGIQLVRCFYTGFYSNSTFIGKFAEKP